jgi:nickel/cobalt transporter (NicO) family protein
MKYPRLRGISLLIAGAAAAAMFANTSSRADTVASLLGNFTINQFCGLKAARDSIAVHYTVVYGQLPALRELHNADADGNGVTSQAERDAYIGTLAPGLADGLELMVDGVRVPLHASRWASSLPTEQGGFSLRIDVDFAAQLPALSQDAQRAVKLANTNYSGQIGWHEMVVQAQDGISVFDTDAFSTSATNDLTDALQSLPASGPLDERSVHMLLAQGGVPAGMRAIHSRSPSDGAPDALGASESAWITQKTRQLVQAISKPKLEPQVAFWTLLAALILGSVHALSPGHGKTVVGAYLIGSRGTPRHALFLGITVTITHTIGVFVLGFATLYASRFIVPERLFPILSLISAVLILGMGLILLVQRGRATVRTLRHSRVSAPIFFAVQSAPALLYAQTHSTAVMHSHGGGPMHSHLPPGADGEKVSWKSLLTLGISGGLVPCPSAMVLLLAAIALNKTAYGMILVLVFSLGLAITLTAVGLVFLYARNRFSERQSRSAWLKLMPVFSAAAITLVGTLLFVSALRTFT